MHRHVFAAFLALIASFFFAQHAVSAPTHFTLAQVLDYPYPSGLVASEDGAHIAWTINQRGMRNVWVAEGPAFKPRQVTQFDADDGVEISQLTFSPDGGTLLFVRGGDHDANWPATGNLPPNPSADPATPAVTIWSVPTADGTAVEVTEGDAPAISAHGVLAYIKDDQVWTAPLDKNSTDKPKRLFFDRGKDGALHWSPDGKRLAFVSDREDHAFIGVFNGNQTALTFLAASTGLDGSPRWSPDGARIAFVRQPGLGGTPQPILRQTPQPWSIWIADASSGEGHRVWASPVTLHGSYPQTDGEANLHWAAQSRLVFLADLDGWPHLYSIADTGEQPLLLTPGDFMVEHVSQSRDRRFMIYAANSGTSTQAQDRRHLFKVPVDAARAVALTHGEGLEWQPVAAGDARVAFIGAGARQPPAITLIDLDGSGRRELQPDLLSKDFPTTQLVVPRAVSFTAADGVVVHGQLFQRAGAADTPGVIFVHGGPPRQMLLGWHYMDYYSNAYAVNQYLANHGFTVLSVNYRLGIGYGHDFANPAHSGPTGAAEYQDVVAGARYLQDVPGVDRTRMGIWGGSYGGYLTALALARNSDLFKAGVDMHGVHDWSLLIDSWFGKETPRYEKGDHDEAMKIAWQSSPDADISTWTSPVLLIHGDDDRNVHFEQTIDLARRLEKQQVPFEELVLPDEIHGFLRHRSWLRADQAAVDFLTAQLMHGKSN